MRVSFFGGGTDYPEYFERHGGAVLGTAIDKCAYHSVTRFYSGLFDYSIRIAYREVECVKRVEDIRHDPFRECLRYCGVERDIEVGYSAELPGFTGLGSSATFVVGLLNALHAYRGRFVAPLELAHQAIEIERDILKDPVGCQDQTFAAVGGLNLIEFRGKREIVVHRVCVSDARRRELEAHLMIFYTGIQRRSASVTKGQIARVSENGDRLARMRAIVDEGHRVLTGSGPLSAFGALLHESWRLKAELDAGVADENLWSLYSAGLEAGALGGKLLGAGGGGFLLFFVPPERREAVRARLARLPEISVSINAPGSQVIHA